MKVRKGGRKEGTYSVLFVGLMSPYPTLVRVDRNESSKKYQYSKNGFSKK